MLRTNPTSLRHMAAACCPGWSRASVSDDVAVGAHLLTSAKPLEQCLCLAQDQPCHGSPLGSSSSSSTSSLPRSKAISQRGPSLPLRSRQSSFVSCTGPTLAQLPTLQHPRPTLQYKPLIIQTHVQPCNTSVRPFRCALLALHVHNLGSATSSGNGKYL